jgi:hypothetical protein
MQPSHATARSNPVTNLNRIREPIQAAAWSKSKGSLSVTKKSSTYKIEVGRDSIDGKFITVKEAESRPRTTEVEHIKIPRKKD